MKIMDTITPHKFLLQIVDESTDPQVFAFVQEKIHIGSNYAPNDLIVNMEGVADRHASIWRSEQGYLTKNLSDSRLTVGQRMLAKGETSDLKSGTVIGIGSIRFRFLEEEAPVAANKNTNHIRQEAIATYGSILRFLKGSKTASRIVVDAIGLGLFILLIMLGTGANYERSDPGNKPSTSVRGPIELPAKGIYGYNKRDKQHPEKAVFTFQTNTSNVELYYTPGQIDANQELSILLNGQPIGYAPTVNKDWGEEAVLRLPSSLLKKGAENILVFDNRKNPPQSNSWGVRNVGIRNLPENLCDRRRARDLIELGDELYNQKTISKGNLFSANRYYSDAMALLQDCSEQGALIKQVKIKRDNSNQELDTLFKDFKFAYTKAYEGKDVLTCINIIEAIKAHIPDKSDKRHQEAAKLLEK